MESLEEEQEILNDSNYAAYIEGVLLKRIPTISNQENKTRPGIPFVATGSGGKTRW